MEGEQFERDLEKFSSGELEVLSYPQNIEWEEKIRERTENFTKCAVIKDDADGPHVPWLFVPAIFKDKIKGEVGEDEIQGFKESFKKVFGFEFLGGYGADGRDLWNFKLTVDCTDEQAQALIEEIENI